MTMTKKYKIMAEYIKDLSSETPDIQTYLFVKDNISKYHLNIEINSKPLKDKLVEVITTLKFEDKELNEKKSHFEIVYATIIKVDDDLKERKDLEKIILCDVPIEIYPNLEKVFINLMQNSGHPNVKIEKKIDFEKLYKEKFN